VAGNTCCVDADGSLIDFCPGLITPATLSTAATFTGGSPPNAVSFSASTNPGPMAFLSLSNTTLTKFDLTFSFELTASPVNTETLVKMDSSTIFVNTARNMNCFGTLLGPFDYTLPHTVHVSWSQAGPSTCTVDGGASSSISLAAPNTSFSFGASPQTLNGTDTVLFDNVRFAWQ
jgi:hypothetical protein